MGSFTEPECTGVCEEAYEVLSVSSMSALEGVMVNKNLQFPCLCVFLH